MHPILIAVPDQTTVHNTSTGAGLFPAKTVRHKIGPKSYLLTRPILKTHDCLYEFAVCGLVAQYLMQSFLRSIED
jgi:hypothetical protein